MFWLKQCPKCHGDLAQESDQYGRYIGCMQCGHTLTAQAEAVLLRLPVSRTMPQPMTARQAV